MRTRDPLSGADLEPPRLSPRHERGGPGRAGRGANLGRSAARAARAPRAHRRHAASCSGWPAAWPLPETFDPKRYTPFEVGVPSEKILCTFPAIDTAVDNIKISQGLEHVARVLDRGTLIRSHVVADLGNILHSRHQYHWHTGYVPPQTVAAPHLGSWIARVRGPRNPAIPAFINIGQRLEGHRRVGGAEGVHDGRLLRQRVRPVQPPLPARRRRRGPAAQGDDAANASTRRRRRYRGAGQAEPAGRAGQRLPPGVDAAGLRQRPSAAQLAGSRCLRPVQGAEGELRPSTTPAGSAWAACWPGG